MDTICNCHSVQDTLHVTSFTYRRRMRPFQVYGVDKRTKGRWDGWPGGQTGRWVDGRLARSIRRHKQTRTSNLCSDPLKIVVQQQACTISKLFGKFKTTAWPATWYMYIAAAPNVTTLSHWKPASAETCSGSCGVQGSHKRYVLYMGTVAGRDNVIGIATRVWTGRHEVRIPANTSDSSLLQTSRQALGSTQWIPVFFNRVKAAGTWFDHSPSCTAEVNNAWMYTSTLPICLHGVDRGNITWVLLLYDRYSISKVT